MRLGLAVGFLTLVALLGGGGRIARAEDGAAIFQAKCVMCHGTDGKGNGPAAVAYTPHPANFTDPALWQKLDRAIIEKTIETGHNDMPPMDQNPAQVKALADYLISTFKPK
jgi:mono/diheme cytochrome c family protein